jgi:hypothetical protein
MRILYQLTSPMDKTVGPQEVARRQKVLQIHASAGTEVIVEPTAKGPQGCPGKLGIGHFQLVG